MQAQRQAPGQAQAPDERGYKWLRMAMMIASILVSIFLPLWNAAMNERTKAEIEDLGQASVFTAPLKVLMSGHWADVNYLTMLLVAATAGYTAILWIYIKRTKQINPECSNAISIFPHFLPYTMLAIITNLALGFFSYMETGGVAHCGDTHIACFGIYPMEPFPHVYIPTGTVLLACWGSFFYNCYTALQRIVNQDFPPSIWISGAFRTAAAVLASMMVFALFFQMGDQAPKLDDNRHWQWKPEAGMNLALVLSFSAGFFPMMTVRQLIRFAGRQLANKTDIFGQLTYSPLTMLDGITSEVQDRLQEAGIDSIQLLAYASVEALKDPLRAGLPFEKAILEDWIDQARLALNFPNEADLKQLKGVGIRSYSNLISYQTKANTPGAPTPDWSAITEVDGTMTSKRFENLIRHGQFPQVKSAASSVKPGCDCAFICERSGASGEQAERD